MKRNSVMLAVMLCVFSLLFTLPVMAEEVEDREMTLIFSFGVRNGVYTGTLTDGVPNGIGTFRSQNQQGDAWTYQGEFVNGTFEGQGALTWESGTCKEGTYHDGMLNGYGSHYIDGQMIYKGYFENGEYSGEGKYYEDGQLIYKGNFENGEYSGEGLRYEDGKLLAEGIFKNGSIFEGVYYSDGNAYQFVNGKVQVSDDSLPWYAILLIAFFLLFILAIIIGFIITIIRPILKYRNSSVSISINNGVSIKTNEAINDAFKESFKQTKPKKIAVECKNCGAKTFYTPGEGKHCEYCHSPLP